MADEPHIDFLGSDSEGSNTPLLNELYTAAKDKMKDGGIIVLKGGTYILVPILKFGRYVKNFIIVGILYEAHSFITISIIRGSESLIRQFGQFAGGALGLTAAVPIEEVCKASLFSNTIAKCYASVTAVVAWVGTKSYEAVGGSYAAYTATVLAIVAVIWVTINFINRIRTPLTAESKDEIEEKKKQLRDEYIRKKEEEEADKAVMEKKFSEKTQIQLVELEKKKSEYLAAPTVANRWLIWLDLVAAYKKCYLEAAKQDKQAMTQYLSKHYSEVVWICWYSVALSEEISGEIQIKMNAAHDDIKFLITVPFIDDDTFDSSTKQTVIYTMLQELADNPMVGGVPSLMMNLAKKIDDADKKLLLVSGNQFMNNIGNSLKNAASFLYSIFPCRGRQGGGSSRRRRKSSRKQRSKRKSIRKKSVRKSVRKTRRTLNKKSKKSKKLRR